LPTTPPKLVRPGQSNMIPFEQVLSNKLHSSLVIPSTVSRKKTIISRSSTSSTAIPLSSSAPSDTKSQFGALLRGIEADVSSLPASPCVKLTINLGKKEKKRILKNYQMQHGLDYNDSIMTKKKGKPSNDSSLLYRTRMRPSLNKWYRVEELFLYNVITTVIKESRVSLSDQDLFNLRMVNKDIANIVPKTCRWLRLDFTPLRAPRYGYKDQGAIDSHRVEMASAAMIHFGLDPGKFVRWLSGEYTGQYRDVC
jgi:hypothetical protein